MNETCVIEQSVNTVSTVQLDPSLDTSTVIHETQHDQTRKTDGSSIQIHLQTSREETNDLSVEQIPSNNSSSNDQKKFQSLVLAMTALKDYQKVTFILNVCFVFSLFIRIRMNSTVLLNIFPSVRHPRSMIQPHI